MNSPEAASPQLIFPPLPELRSATVFGRTIRYYDVGAGPVLVLIHGIGGDADEWAFCFEPLAASHRVIAFDLLGFGRSDKPLIEYTVAGFVEVLERFLRGLGIERASLLGASLGGWIAASFALRFPDEVDKLILVDSAAAWGDTTELPIDLHVSTRAHLREVFDLLFYDSRLATEELVDLAYELHLERGDGYTIDSVLRNLQSGRERLDATIGDVKARTLIVWGEQDRMIPVSVGRRLQQLIAGSRLEVIAECGHLPALEKPAEFVRCVLSFLGQ
ncbi:MAG: alpha/beta fold hydrolase [Candidatus Korobacteraceae bacterium]